MVHLSVALTAIITFSVVAAENLLQCGESQYYPSQYTCFDDDFLCPMVNGDRYFRCGLACYSTKEYSCATTTLQPISAGPQNCSETLFDPTQWVCLDRYIFCPIKNGTATLNCGDDSDPECYDPSVYGCAIGQLYPIGTTPPTCVSEYEDPNYCNYYGCTPGPCCAGLWDSADRCRPL
ncbi:carbohydrate binding-domain-containing protein [Mycena galopus ATCC 62051]|nr:carbohydrate binding-domain-containing protein [Mycena galopus ATCC 62051]